MTLRRHPISQAAALEFVALHVAYAASTGHQATRSPGKRAM